MIKRHFLFQRSGSTEPTRAGEPIDTSLPIRHPAGPSWLLPNERKGEAGREKKGTFKLLSKKLIFFSPFLFFTETRNSQMQVKKKKKKKQKVCYNVTKSSAAGLGAWWGPERGGGTARGAWSMRGRERRALALAAASAGVRGACAGLQGGGRGGLSGMILSIQKIKIKKLKKK